MSQASDRGRRIIIWAYVARYVLPIAILLPAAFFKEEQHCVFALGMGAATFAVYHLAGFHFRWKHWYCAWQDAHRERMTPRDIRWHTVKKKEVCGISAIFGILGAAAMIGSFFI